MKNILISIHTRQILTIIQDNYSPQLHNLNIFQTNNYSEACEKILNFTIDIFFIEDYIPHEHSESIMGFQLMKKIRQIKKYRFTPIFFFSKLENSILYAYHEFHCFSCLEYPFNKEKFSNDFNLAIAYLTPREDHHDIYFKQNGIFYHFPINTIIFIKCQRLRILLARYKNKLEMYSYHSCKQLLETLDSIHFIQCAKGTIVNQKYIKSIDESTHQIKLIGTNEILIIGHNFRKSFYEAIEITRKSI